MTDNNPTTSLSSKIISIFLRDVALMLAIVMFFAWYINRLVIELHNRNSDFIIGITILFVPLSIIQALRNAHGLYILQDSERGKELERKRGRMRLLGELASALALFGTVFSLASAYKAFDAADKMGHFSVLIDSYSLVKPSLSPEICESGNIATAFACKGFTDTFNELARLQLDDASDTKIREKIRALGTSASILQHHLPSDRRSQFDIFIQNLNNISPPFELERRFYAIAVFSGVLLAASLAACLKLGVAIYDAKQYVPFSSASKKVLARQGEG